MKLFIARTMAYSIGFWEAMHFKSWTAFEVSLVSAIAVYTIWSLIKKAWGLDKYIVNEPVN